MDIPRKAAGKGRRRWAYGVGAVAAIALTSLALTRIGPSAPTVERAAAGTPLLLQLFVIYFGLAPLVELPAFVAALVGLAVATNGTAFQRTVSQAE